MARDKGYNSFMLRLWWAQSDNCPTWFVSMQDILTGQQIWFPNVEELICYLQAEYGGAEDPHFAGPENSSEMDGQTEPGIGDLEE